MAVFSIKSAAADLPDLIDQALAGNEIVIADGDQGQVRLEPIRAAPRGKRVFGALKERSSIGPLEG